MASAYGILDNFNDPLYTPDFAAISTALEFKQGKLDANREALAKYNDDLINSIDVLKDEDKQYANERIEAVTKLVNQYSGQDLSNDGLLLSLKTDLSQVLDDNVKNAVYSTALYNAEQAQWKKQKEENPDKYSDDNYRYAQQNAQVYLSDGKVGSKYKGGGGFIEFKDVQADLNKQLPDRLKEKGIYSTLDDQGNEYYYDITTGQKITNEDVMGVMRTIITPQHEKQLAINAWAKYDHIPDEAIQYQFNQNKATQVADLDSDINTIQTLLNDSSVKGEERKQYLAMLPQLKAQKFDVNSQEYSPANKQGIYTQIYQKDFYGNFASAYSVDKVTDIKRSAKWEKQEELKFAYDVERKEIDQANAIELLGVKAMFDAEAAGASGKDLDGDSSTKSGDNLFPSGKGWAVTEAEEVFNPYTQVQTKQAELINDLGNTLFPELLVGGAKKTETMNAIQDFAMVADESSFNEADGTYEYVFGVNQDGSPKTKRMTKEDADKIYDLKVNTHRYTEATKVVVSQIDDAATTLQDAMSKATDFNFENLRDYNIEVYTKPNGQDAIRPKTGNSPSFATLLQMKGQGKQLTADQQKTLDLYTKLETTDVFVNESDDTESATTHSKAYLSNLQTKYVDGGIYIPSDANSLRSNERKKTSYVSPDEYKGGFFLLNNSNDPNVAIAKKVIADQVFGGVLPKVEGLGDATFSGSFSSYKDENLTLLDKKIYEISQSKDPLNYKVTDKDKAQLRIVVSRNIVNHSSGIYDTNFADAQAGDLENETGYTLNGGQGASGFVKAINKNIIAGTDNLLTDYNKKDQNFYLSFNEDKKYIHTKFNEAFLAEGNTLQIAEKGTVQTVFDGDVVKIYGQFTKPNADGTKREAVLLTPAEAITMTKEQFQSITGIVEEKEKITPFNATFKNPMIETFTPKASEILTSNVLESMNLLATQTKQKTANGQPLTFDKNVVETTLNSTQVQIKPIDGSYYVVMNVPTRMDDGSNNMTSVPLFDMGTAKPSVQEVKEIMQNYNTTPKLLSDPVAVDVIQSILLQNQINISNTTVAQ